jgi:hypothetical protein
MFSDFWEKYRKPLLILGFVLIVAAIGYLLYFTFFRSYLEPGPTGPGSTTTPGSGSLPEAGPGGATTSLPGGPGQLPGEEPGAQPEGTPEGQPSGDSTRKNDTAVIFDGQSQDMTLSGDGSGVQYYDRENGKFYRIDEKGNVQSLSDKVFHNVEKVNWSPNKKEAILEYPDGSNILFNFDSGKQVTLPKHWEEFDFSPEGRQIVAKSIGLDPDNRWLAVSNSDGSEVRAVEAIGENEDSVYPSWSPTNQIVGMYTRGIGFNRQDVFFIGQNDENFRSMRIEGRGFQSQWSPEGDRLMYSVYSDANGFKPQLWITSSKPETMGAGRKSLNVETWANKCTFANNTRMYCAVPKDLEEGAGIFPEMADMTTDELYRIDTETGIKELVSGLPGGYNISNLEVSADGENLFFTDSRTGEIHKLDLN